MTAIIETGGKQYKVAEGDVLFIEKLGVEAGDEVKFDKVLAILGDEPKFGAPVVEGASVDASVVKNGKRPVKHAQGRRRSATSATSRASRRVSMVMSTYMRIMIMVDRPSTLSP